MITEEQKRKEELEKSMEGLELVYEILEFLRATLTPEGYVKDAIKNKDKIHGFSERCRQLKVFKSNLVAYEYYKEILLKKEGYEHRIGQTIGHLITKVNSVSMQPLRLVNAVLILFPILDDVLRVNE